MLALRGRTLIVNVVSVNVKLFSEPLAKLAARHVWSVMPEILYESTAIPGEFSIDSPTDEAYSARVILSLAVHM